MGASLFLSHVVLMEEFAGFPLILASGCVCMCVGGDMGDLSKLQRTSLMVQASHTFITRRLVYREGMLH